MCAVNINKFLQMFATLPAFGSLYIAFVKFSSQLTK